MVIFFRQAMFDPRRVRCDVGGGCHDDVWWSFSLAGFEVRRTLYQDVHHVWLWIIIISYYIIYFIVLYHVISYHVVSFGCILLVSSSVVSSFHSCCGIISLARWVCLIIWYSAAKSTGFIIIFQMNGHWWQILNFQKHPCIILYWVYPHISNNRSQMIPAIYPLYYHLVMTNSLPWENQSIFNR